MIGFFDRLARPFLRALDPEDAHGLAIKMLKFAPLPSAPRDDNRLASRGSSGACDSRGANFKSLSVSA